MRAHAANTNSYGHTQLVSQYFSCVEGFTQPEVIKKVELPGAKTSKPGAAAGGSGGALSSLPAALSSLLGKLLAGGGSDPFYAVVAYRNFRREDA